MNKGRKEYTFLWFIENYSCSWHRTGEELNSPGFRFDGLDRTNWFLDLYPKGFKDEAVDSISIFLRRSYIDTGPEEFPLKFELSVLAVDGSVLDTIEVEHIFKKWKIKKGAGSFQFVQRNKILLQRKAEYLPNDTLSLRCRMWEGEGEIQKTGKISARTRICVENISFLHVVENFSKLQSNVKQTIQVQSCSIEGDNILSSLYFTDGSCCEEKMIIEIDTTDDLQILQKCEFSLIDGTGNIIKCGGINYTYDSEITTIRKVPLSITRKVVLDRNNEYLPDDRLSLLCECCFSRREIERDTIEEVQHELPMIVTKKLNNYADSKDIYQIAEQNLAELPSVSEDMKALYKTQRMTDVELKTKTKSFPAHKIVLCARSPVFEAMMTSDMREKKTDCVQIDDLENDTVQQLLLFLYSDTVEILHCNTAIQLYYAADKYQIRKLKSISSSFLAENLNTSNASDLLLLADSHADSDLKKLVEDFILDHEEQVFGSDGWEKLIEANPLLVIKTMHLKYKRKNENT